MGKSVLEVIPVFWMSVAWIPRGFLERDKSICFKFLWAYSQEHFSLPWVNWKHNVMPKFLGNSGLKNIFWFSETLATKCGWELISTFGLRTWVVYQKYIHPYSLEVWV